MRRVLLLGALVLSVWPAAVVAFGVSRVLTPGEDSEQVAETPAAERPARATTPTETATPVRTTTTPARTTTTPARTTTTATATTTAVTTTTNAEPDAATRAVDLATLNGLREETASLVVGLDETIAATGDPDSQLAGIAEDLSLRLSRWRIANRGLNEDAEYFAQLFQGIAARTAAFARVPTSENRERVSRALDRHRRATLRGGRTGGDADADG